MNGVCTGGGETCSGERGQRPYIREMMHSGLNL